MDVFFYFALAKSVSLLVDIFCPQGCSDLDCLSIFGGLAPLRVLTLHGTLHHWFVAVFTVTIHFFFSNILSSYDRE